MKVLVDLEEEGGTFLGVLGVQRMIEDLIKGGFEAPIYFAIIAANGAILTGLFDASAGRELRSHVTHVHCPSGWFTNPVHALYVDTHGRARHLPS